MKIRNILVPTDFSETSDRALDYAVRLAGVFGATLHLMHVVEMPLIADPLPGAMMWAYPSPAVMEEARHFLEDLRARVCVRSRIEIGKGVPWRAILAYADEMPIDLIVMATHGRRGIARVLLGSTTEAVLRRAKCPVLSIRPAASQKAKKPTTVGAEQPTDCEAAATS